MSNVIDATAFRAHYGPWAVVCGASDGTGAAYAHQLAELGLNLVLIARRLGVLEDLAASLERRHGISTRIAAVDLAERDASRSVIGAAAGLEVGLLVTNAGADTTGKSFLDAPLDVWRSLVQRNVLAVTELVHGFAAPMRERRRGGILLMSSGTALGGQPGTTVYCGTKGYDLNLAESLWGELAPFGVDVLAGVCPAMNTPTLQRVLADKNIVVPGLFEPSDVVRTLLGKLSNGPVHIFAFGEEAENAFALEQSRRTRVIAMQNISKVFFSEEKSGG